MARDPAAIVSDAEQAAQQARALLDQPALQRAFAAAEAAYLTRIRQSDPVTGKDERETNFMLLHALDALRADLTATASGGAIARRNFRSSLNSNGRS
ncbi:MAG TPA: hypothetical protein VGM87_13965 [Roseomonas sp.]|jgi:hypothetical protein